jgi:hypothetical protein
MRLKPPLATEDRSSNGRINGKVAYAAYARTTEGCEGAG